MRYYTICYPDENTLGQEYTHWETLSEKEILDDYWTYWYIRMVENNQPIEKLTSEWCIHDWCITHWAERNYWREMKDCIA
jgi:hypothetical protein